MRAESDAAADWDVVVGRLGEASAFLLVGRSQGVGVERRRHGGLPIMKVRRKKVDTALYSTRSCSSYLIPPTHNFHKLQFTQPNKSKNNSVH